MPQPESAETSVRFRRSMLQRNMNAKFNISNDTKHGRKYIAGSENV